MGVCGGGNDEVVSEGVMRGNGQGGRDGRIVEFNESFIWWKHYNMTVPRRFIATAPEKYVSIHSLCCNQSLLNPTESISFQTSHSILLTSLLISNIDSPASNLTVHSVKVMYGGSNSGQVIYEHPMSEQWTCSGNSVKIRLQWWVTLAAHTDYTLSVEYLAAGYASTGYRHKHTASVSSGVEFTFKNTDLQTQDINSPLLGLYFIPN